MKIYYASDVHSEYLKYPDIPHLDLAADVIVFAGDIGIADDTLTFLEAVAETYPHTHLVWVAGNHEFYGTDIESQLYEFRQHSARHPRIHFLENERLQLGGVTFLGCTLWTDFTALGDEMGKECIANSQRLADFFYIYTQHGKFSAEDAIARFRGSHSWLKQELANCNPQKTLVISHFPPCREARHGEIPEDYLAVYFQANARDLIEEFQPRYWIYGHNHWSDRFLIGDTLLTSNQLGYPQEASVQARFNLRAFIEI